MRPAADAFSDVEAEALEPAVLHGVVGHEAHGRDAQVDEHLGPDAVLPAVDGKALLEVGLDRVVAFFLELVRPDLVAEADAAPLVAPQVDEDAATLLFDQVERGVQLRAAVAAKRAEHVAGQALRVHADQDVLGARDVAHDERQVLLVVEDGLVD